MTKNKNQAIPAPALRDVENSPASAPALPAESAVLFSGAEKYEFTKALVQAFADGKNLLTPAGVLLPPLSAELGSYYVSMMTSDNEIKRVTLNKAFSAVRLAQKASADDCDLVRQFKDWLLTDDAQNTPPDEYALFTYDLKRLNRACCSLWAVQLIRKYISSAGLVSRAKGVPKMFYYQLSDVYFYVRVNGLKRAFSDDEREAWKALSAVHTED